MAPIPSKFARERCAWEQKQGPEDFVFHIATERVRPAIEGLIAILSESADSILSAAKGASDTTTAAALEVADLLARASRGAGQIMQDAANGAGWLVCSTAFGSTFEKFLNGQGQSLPMKLPVGFIVWLLGLLYCAFVFAYLPAAGLAFSSPTSMVFHAFIYLTMASFFQAVATDPGGVPESPEWRTEGKPPEALLGLEGERVRWCQHEGCYKPQRAHRCGVTGTNVLRMDHHCPWIANTVGWGNHKFFYLFLLYATGACVMFDVNVLQLLVHATLPALTKFLLVGSEGLGGLLGAILGPFFVFHTWLLSKNMTTIEFMEGPDRRRKIPRPRGQEPREDGSQEQGDFGGQSAGCDAAASEATDSDAEASQDEAESRDGSGDEAGVEEAKASYDAGIYANVCSVLGTNPLTWLLPVGAPPGDGLTFPTATASSSSSAAAAGSASAPAEEVMVLATGAGAGCTADLWEPDPEDPERPAGDDHDEVVGGLADEAAAAASATHEVGWLPCSPGEFAEDLSVGVSFVGEKLSSCASEASSRLTSWWVLGPDPQPETKARRPSWRRHVLQAEEAAALRRGGVKLPSKKSSSSKASDKSRHQGA